MVNCPAFGSILPGYFLSSARLIAMTAVTCAALSTMPVIVPFSAARAGTERRYKARSGRAQRTFTIVLLLLSRARSRKRRRRSALIRRQVVQIDVQHQRRHRRRIDLVRLDKAGLRRARRNVPAPIRGLLGQQQLADLRMPAVPVLAASLVGRLDGVVVVIVEVLSAAGPRDRQSRQGVQRRQEALVLGMAEQLQRENAGRCRLWPDAGSGIPEAGALRSASATLHILDRVLERLLGHRNAGVVGRAQSDNLHDRHTHV